MPLYSNSKRHPIPSNPNIFVLSGCLDPKISFDSREPDGTPCGLLSYWLRKTLEKYNYQCIIDNLITDIKKGFGSNDQTPVISVNSNDYIPTTIVFDKIVLSQPNQLNPPNPPNPPKPSNPPKSQKTNKKDIIKTNKKDDNIKDKQNKKGKMKNNIFKNIIDLMKNLL